MTGDSIQMIMHNDKKQIDTKIMSCDNEIMSFDRSQKEIDRSKKQFDGVRKQFAEKKSTVQE